MTTMLWEFSAMDSLFFRDGKPMNMGESAWVDSLFPPTGQTLQGAIRAAILDFLDADISKFQKGENCLPDGGSLKEEIGDATSLGNLKLSGPFVDRAGQLFFPAPFDLVKNRDGAFGLLAPSQHNVPSDAGTIRFPCISGRGYKTQEDNFISSESLDNLLRNTTDDLELVPLIAESREHSGLADREPKVGLARDNSTRTNIEGMLFAIAPVRPRPEVSLMVAVRGAQEKHYPSDTFLQKLGGEGKLARITTGGHLTLPGPYINKQDDRIRFKIVLISPALLEERLLIPDADTLQKRRQEPGVETTLWQGLFEQCRFEVVTACIGKPKKIGGWNMKKWKAEPLRSFIPAGSVFFCEADTDQEQAVLDLHDIKTGQKTEYGFGHILIGKWDYTGAKS